MFKDSCKDIDELTDVICSNAIFCENMIIPTKKIKVLYNNKPWISKAVKSSLQKKLFFSLRGASEVDSAKREVKVEILRAKQKYTTREKTR